jgi:hypothetical protein
MVEAVDQFAREALRLREWVLFGSSTGPIAAREALVLVTRLYLTALALPPVWCGEHDHTAEAPAVAGSRSGQDIYSRLAARLPFQQYGEVFNPLPVPPEQPVVGDVADDLTDIFAEVDGGLRQYEAGHRTDAVWEWGFYLVHHWGEHATSAMRALHCFLAAASPDLLASRSK